MEINAELSDSVNAAAHGESRDAARIGNAGAVIEEFRTAGYAVDVDYSFMVRGRGPDGSPVGVTVFARGHTVHLERNAVYPSHIDCVEGRGVVPSWLPFGVSKSDLNVYAIGDSVWLGSAGPPPAASAPPFAAAALPSLSIAAAAMWSHALVACTIKTL